MRSSPEIPEVVTSRLGVARPVRRLPSSPRSRVWLVEFDGGPAIVKHVVAGPDADSRYANELTALRLAGPIRPAVVPALLAADPDSRLLVLEYLDAQPPTEHWLLDYAANLAGLHSAALGADTGQLPRHTGPTDADIAAFLRLTERLGAPVGANVHTELAALRERLDSAPRDALLHGDPCPDNNLRTAAGPRFVDLEGACLGNGLVELAYLRIGFPTCWCVTTAPPALLAAAEDAYRAAWRARTGDDPAGDLVDACAGWLIQGDALVPRAERNGVDHLDRVAAADWDWGTTSARGRLLHRTAVVAALATDRPQLINLGKLCASLVARMRRHWPESARKTIPITRPPQC